MQKNKEQLKLLSIFMAGVEGLEPSRTVLETMSVIKDRKIVPTVEPLVALGLLNLMPFDALLMLLKNLCGKKEKRILLLSEKA